MLITGLAKTSAKLNAKLSSRSFANGVVSILLTRKPKSKPFVTEGGRGNWVFPRRGNQWVPQSGTSARNRGFLGSEATQVVQKTYTS